MSKEFEAEKQLGIAFRYIEKLSASKSDSVQRRVAQLRREFSAPVHGDNRIKTLVELYKFVSHIHFSREEIGKFEHMMGLAYSDNPSLCRRWKNNEVFYFIAGMVQPLPKHLGKAAA